MDRIICGSVEISASRNARDFFEHWSFFLTSTLKRTEVQKPSPPASVGWVEGSRPGWTFNKIMHAALPGNVIYQYCPRQWYCWSLGVARIQMIGFLSDYFWPNTTRQFLGFFFLMNLRMNFFKSKSSGKCIYWCYARRGFQIKGKLISTLKSQSRTVSILGLQGYTSRSRDTVGEAVTCKQGYPLPAQLSAKSKRPQQFGLRAPPPGDFLTNCLKGFLLFFPQQRICTSSTTFPSQRCYPSRASTSVMFLQKGNHQGTAKQYLDLWDVKYLYFNCILCSYF